MWYLFVGIPALAGLSVLHGLVPPHPGPLVAIAALHADLGLTVLYGIIIAIPTVIIAGPVFGHFAMRWGQADPPRALVEPFEARSEIENPPGLWTVLFTVLLPVILMLIRTVADVTLEEDAKARQWADFIGEPAIALLIGVIVAMFTFGVRRGIRGRELNRAMTASLAPAASILLIIGAGGGFKQVLIDTSRPLLVLAIGCGSLFLSHVNDAGFWLINQYFGMSVPDTFKTWSAMETIISVVGFVFVLAASVIV